MVWIPGGGFQQSEGARFPGDVLATNDVVVVTLNYRAGVFGFVAHPDLDAGRSVSGNFGLQDQIRALRWVRENIGGFGGDPGNVTIFGESAGAAAVALLMCSPEARGLFHRAIGQSCGPWESVHGSTPTRDEAEDRATGLLARLNVKSFQDAREIAAEELNAVAGWRPPRDPLTHGFSPSIDGWILPDSPFAIMARGEHAAVPLLAGWNAAEGVTFAPFCNSFDDAASIRTALVTWWGAEHASAIDRLYPSTDEGIARSSLIDVIADVFVVEQTWEWLQRHAEHAGAATFGYTFGVTSAYTPVPVHTVEIDYVFGRLGAHWLAPESGIPDERDHEVSQQMGAYWTNFATSGDPNGAGLPTWPVYAPASPHVMTFAIDDTRATVEEGTERFRFIQGMRGADLRRPASWRGRLIAP
jgi:para-nitrobenzyl esterase